MRGGTRRVLELRASVLFHTYVHVKSRSSGQGVVANRRDTTGYRCGLSLAPTRTTQLHFVHVCVEQDTSSLAACRGRSATAQPQEAIGGDTALECARRVGASHGDSAWARAARASGGFR